MKVDATNLGDFLLSVPTIASDPTDGLQPEMNQPPSSLTTPAEASTTTTTLQRLRRSNCWRRTEDLVKRFSFCLLLLGVVFLLGGLNSNTDMLSLLTTILLPGFASFGFLIVVAGAMTYGGRYAASTRPKLHFPPYSRGTSHEKGLSLPNCCAARLFRRHVMCLDDSCEDSAASRAEKAIIESLKALPCHVVAEEDQAAALEAGEEPPECPLCLSTVLPGETIRTLPCSQYAAPGTNGLPLHAHHPRSTLTLHSRVFAQLAAPSTKRASIGG